MLHLHFTVIILFPCLCISVGVFPLSYFRAWVVFSFLIGSASAAVIILLPIWEARNKILNTALTALESWGCILIHILGHDSDLPLPPDIHHNLNNAHHVFNRKHIYNLSCIPEDPDEDAAGSSVSVHPQQLPQVHRFGESSSSIVHGKDKVHSEMILSNHSINVNNNNNNNTIKESIFVQVTLSRGDSKSEGETEETSP